ncbi:MAG TPA: phenylalanine--tRNA ligase subunit beta [Kofleriaceae bacterium]|nr:phenylalanine--tRNA ligase subunit beta [Kofleriaceae bacterium]
MKVLWSWLLELCDLDRVPTVEEGARALTRGGLEVEGMTDLGAGFRGVVVAEVVGKQPHPKSDKLTLVDVITERGGAATQVVCGANNVPEPGGRVLWAQIGAVLPNGMTLAPKEVRGVVSPGMLCSEDELGLGADHSGIIVLDAADRTPLGAPGQRALGLDDWLLELNAPANRGDVLGHLGVARELAAMLNGKLVWPDTDLAAHRGGAAPVAYRIAIADPDACPRYTARAIEGVRVGPSPVRIAQRLRGVGVRPISNLVDITNYVMFELGQPLHAFDAATLETNIIGVTPAADGERFQTLDGVERALVAGDLVIRDRDRAIALAGVMGGLATEVTDKTTRVLLEAASFRAVTVRRTGRRLGLRSEASLRFERGVDPELAEIASARAARLMCELAGGTVAGDVFDAYPGARRTPAIVVRMPRVRMLSGMPLDVATSRDALARLGFQVGGGEADGPIGEPADGAADGAAGGSADGAAGEDQTLRVTPPSARADVTREVDVIEEIVRVVGYEQVGATIPTLRQAPGVRPANAAELARAALANAGASEAITFAYQSVERNAALGLPATDRRAQPIAIQNPMSADQAVMRTSLLPNLLAAVARNGSHGRPDVALFEVGSVFLRRGEGAPDQPIRELADEPVWVAGVVAGRRPAQIGLGAPYDVFDAKALALVVVRAIAGSDAAVRTQPARDISYLHPGVAGQLVLSGPIVFGWFGEVHPAVRARLGVDGAVYAFELELARIPLAPPPQMRPIPRFPGSARDVSLLLGDAIPAGRVEEVIAEAGEALVSRVRLLEEYRDAKLGEGQKSMLWSIEYRSPERTLTDVEVDRAHEAIVARLVDALPAQRR